MNREIEEIQEDLLAKAAKAADELYNIRDTYFPADPNDKISKLQAESDLVLQTLNSIPPENRKLPIQRAMYEYLKGKVLDVFSDYRKDAEDHLSKAGPNKRILCQLSMLERKMAQGTEKQAEIVEESIKHAREAIALDVRDGNSWYNLGNACLTSFFVTGAWDHSKLLQSLKAYQNAERDETMKSSPDLYFNCATVNKYLENYERALTGFEAAALKDPGLNATEEVEKIVHLLDKLESLLKGQTKAKRLASLASSLSTVNVNPSYIQVSVDRLAEGLNKGVAVVGKVLYFIKHQNVAPLYYLLCDANQICYVLSVYGIRDDVVKEGDQIILLSPYFHNVDFSWNGKVYQFKSVRVDFLEQMLVNGKALSHSHAVRASIYAQHKP
ncbi:uncharacterized protein [Coffea arabica]|uniref:Uncharacterized protein isoform X2 n=1 Tax=Coffea arabica TaxID=13443 RepID=A0A6P6V0D9_COFAR|nr:tetratricopeptide repeat protein 5-like isoform X2 [Coffea arabica]XP_027098084.1 tetratricopeptide repeat protein 5-like isoform X2 [Coffea arabica]